MTAESAQGSRPSIFDRILSDGHAVVDLEFDEYLTLTSLYKRSGEFFGADPERKLRYSVPNRVSGYRPHGYAHAGSPDEPDLNDSFLYWRRRRETLPHHEEIGPFLDVAEEWRAIVALLTRRVLDSMREHYAYERELTFEQASVLQVNSYAEPAENDLLQQQHEDAVLLTVIWTSAPGLEGVVDGRLRQFDLGEDQVLVMPGSVMTLMTGGQVEPFFHQVRNYGNLGRKSIMFFVSPDADEPIEPFVRNETNAGVDIRTLVIENPQAYFGLSEDFVTA